MNTISTIGRMAMDGQSVYSNFSQQKVQVPEIKSPMPKTASDVLKNFEANKAETEASARELQRLSDLVTGHKLQFNVNQELDKVVVRVVDTSTNEVIREIPSEDLQRIQARMKHAIGVLFDEMI
ncbi:MAG: flagellar protein FlaG [Treponema sp.]|nr:flagellar protein FlaG [Spirochaetia bacterium]MDD7581033.1 flagellar protein FlaG [Treponema sp.]MCI7440461.1 flagellar protein FlaG [Spirochaetia bacterium]MDY3758093.1 flagellar protein FlaG [Treponema sp.]MDY4130056.1 flagellar protein FlaG [Treponema sp.]